MTITFMGLQSVTDRTLFTDLGPIVKNPIPILVGTNLQIFSNTDVKIDTGNFTQDFLGFQIQISGSAGLRNNGTFLISQVLSSTQLRLDNVNFDISDIQLTTNKIVALANDLKTKFNGHRTQPGIHGTPDTVNVVNSEDAVDLTSVIILLNDIRSEFAAHVLMTSGMPPVHTAPDLDDFPTSEVATNFASAVLLANDLRQKFENHRTLNSIHLSADFTNIIVAQVASVVTNVYPGPLTGPFPWTIYDPRFGEVANSPADVSVSVNSIPASIDAVFGLLGAVVLTNKPGPTDNVSISYNYIKNPPSRLLRLNSPEFHLNQDGNTGYSGFPNNQYKARSYLIDPSVNTPDLVSAVEPQQIQWKYKAYERAYSAVLNDPNTLLLNVPSNKVMYPVLFTEVQETTVRYDPTTLPQNSTDPWTLEGVGTFSLAPGGTELTIIDSNEPPGINNEPPGLNNKPPYFSHVFNFIAPSIVSSAFRAYASDWTLHGCFSGISFGISDGNFVSLVGFLQTNATNLSSAIQRLNDIKSNFNAHLIQPGVHIPNDPLDSEIFVVHDLPSAIVLVNDLKAKFNAHLNKAGLSGVHIIIDTSNVILIDDADDLDSVINLSNVLSDNFNNHRTANGIHFSPDDINVVPLVKQVGFLTNRGFPESELSWNAFNTDFTTVKTYRLSRDPDGNVSLFLSGDSAPEISAQASELPSISDLDGRFDPVQQIFFGSIEKETKSTSGWNFIRANINPLDANLLGSNKYVDLIGIPELADPPWITIGQGGIERLLSGNVLLVDSTCSAPTENIPLLGLSSGSYKGFLRIEPIITDTTTVVYETTMQLDYYTFSVDNRAAGLYIDDDDFTIQLSFIQYAPSPATTTGSKSEPFSLISTDYIIFNVGTGPNITINFNTNDTLAAVILNINTICGFPFVDSNLGKIRFTSPNLGAEASFSIISGPSLAKFGLSPGIYFGRDSNPEPRVSWFGENLPDTDTSYPWNASGNQSADLFGRTLRITDSSSSDFKIYTQANLLVTNDSFNPSVNWKLDARLAILSFSGPAVVPTNPPFLNLGFAGALVSVDEGPFGKNLELQLSVDVNNNQYINIVSYNSITNTLDVKGQFAFAWNDGSVHSFNIYVNKSIDSIFILADGINLSPITATPNPTYSGLNAGFSGPSISFGSGTAPITGVDLSSCQSVVDWQSVSIFRDSKIGDSTSPLRKFIGIYKGGDPTILDSYYLTQHDFSTLSTYRIVRDPSSAVSVYINNNPTPSITTSYDVLSLPLVESSFFRGISQNRSVIAFGSFNPQEIVRTRWNDVQYSVGKVTLTNLLVPQHQVLNQANVVVSPEHLTSNVPHKHFGFSVYSGGTPTDDFLADSSTKAFTILGEGTPPVPATQNLETRGGLQKVITPFDDIITSNFVNTQGFLSNYIDDTVNIVPSNPPNTYNASLNSLMLLTNNIKSNYNNHIISLIPHLLADTFNASVSPPATDLPSSILLINELKAKFNLHLIQAGVHTSNDTSHTVILANATDLPSAVNLANSVRNLYEAHRLTDSFHEPNDLVNTLTSGTATIYQIIGSLEEIRVKFALHAASSVFHIAPDNINGVYFDTIPGVSYAVVRPDPVTLLNINIQQFTLSVYIGDFITFLSGPNLGKIVPVSQILNNSFNVAPSIALISTTTKYPIARVPPVVVGVGTAQVNASLNVLISISVPVSVGDVIAFAFGPNAGQRQTITRIITSTIAEVGHNFNSIDSVGSIFQIFNADSSSISIDETRAYDVANKIKGYFDNHLTATSVHYTQDTIDNIASVPDAMDATSFLNLINAIHASMNNHFIGNVVHLDVDIIDVVVEQDIQDPQAESILVTNEILQEFNAHLSQYNVHVANDTVNTIISSAAVDLSSLIALLNLEKADLNSHLLESGVHVLNDTFNTVTTPDATDLPSAIDLAIALETAYNSHRVQPGVHGSSVFIRLDPPTEVLYDSMKFFTTETGTPNLVAPFSDDE